MNSGKEKVAKAEAKAKAAAKEQFENARNKFKFENLDEIINRSNEFDKKINNDGPLAKFYNQIKLLISMVKDYRNGSYREIPLNTILSVGATLLYVLSPIDLIPDFIPIIGLIDDAAVVALCLKMVQSDIENYGTWKNNQKN